jgi:DDE family transposase
LFHFWSLICSHVKPKQTLDFTMFNRYIVGMYIAMIPNRNSPPAYLLRESFRQDGKVKNRTLANLSSLPIAQIHLIQRVLKNEALVPVDELFEIKRGHPHGHVVAVLGTLRKLGLDRMLDTHPSRERRLVEAMIVARILLPASKLATARMLAKATAASSLGALLEIDDLDEDDLYEALDWLRTRQADIERKLASAHLKDGSLILYDLTSTYYTGRCCPLAKYGHNRDGKKRFPQIVIALLCDREGRPIAVEVFEGNTSDPKTVQAQIEKLRMQFNLERILLVGDRGVLTSARINKDLRTVEGMQWITALRAQTIRKLASQKTITMSLFDERDLAEVTSPDFPGERLFVCYNPLLADERARKRQTLLKMTEEELEKIARAVRRKQKPLRGKKDISLRAGKILNRHKVGKHFRLQIGAASFEYHRKEAKIAEEASLDGIYVLRSNVPREDLNAEQTVAAYKGLAEAEQAFRSFKSVDLKVRPIFHWEPERVKAHVFLCMLSYYVEWHMREKLAELLFDEDDKEGARAARASIVAPAKPSPSCRAKANTKQTPDRMPVHSFRTLLEDLKTLSRDEVYVPASHHTFIKLHTATRLQQRVFELLEVTP